MTTRWIGRYLVLLGFLHMGIGLVAFHGQLIGMFSEGLWDSLGSEAEREHGVFSILAGALLTMLGGLADAFEAQDIRFPRWFGWGLLAVFFAGAIVAPASGIWLLLPAAYASLRRRYVGWW